MGILDTVIKATAIKTAGKLGESAIESIAKHSSDAVVAHMEKQRSMYVYAPKSAENFRGMDYEEVEKELSAFGFKNINLLEKKDLKNNWFFKADNRKVTNISIDGKTEFRKKAKFFSDAHVVITYHTFKN